MKFDILSRLSVVIACAMLLCAGLITLQRHASGSSDEPSPSYCIYNYLEEYATGDVSLDSNGTMYLRCMGFEEIEVDNESVQTVKFTSSLTAEVTGWMKVSDWSGTHTYDVGGYYKLKAEEFYDPDTGWLVRSIVDEEISLGDWLYYSERNETTFSDLVASPAGFGVYGQGLSTPPGSNWTVWYSIDSAVDGFSDDERFEERYVDRLMTTYTCTAIESLNVSAGLFECIKVEYSDCDTDFTEWYCPAIGYSVNMTSTTDYGTVTFALIEYDDGVRQGEENGIPWILVAGIASVAGALIAVVVAAVLILRKKNGKQDMPPPQNMEEVG